jgi:stage II sporulation protein R
MGGILMKTLIIKERNLIVFSIIIALLICFASIGYTANQYTYDIQKDLAGKLIRFHCIANSDSKEDQALKLKVRDAILLEMKGKLENSESIDETRKILLANEENIKKIAKSIISKEGKAYKVEVNLEKDVSFPIKKYGDIILPAGKYEAFRVVIGEGEGKN